MVKKAAGLLMYKIKEGKIKVFIGHHGGPYYAKKDEGSWMIPKGELEEGEELLAAAKREFEEETGVVPPSDDRAYFSLGNILRKDRKEIHIWAFEGDWSGLLMQKSFVTLEWPPKSGKMITFPEIDRVLFTDIDKARKKVWPSLIPFLDRLEEKFKK